MTVRISAKGVRIKIDVERAKTLLVPLIIGAIQERVREGLDTSGNPFASYTPAYRRQLTAMGEDQRVDLRLTGGLLNSLRLLRSESARGRLSLWIGPGTGTSARVAPPVDSARPRAARQGGRGPAHNVLGAYLHHGTPRMRARPWLGLAPQQRKWLRETVAKLGLFSTKK